MLKLTLALLFPALVSLPAFANEDESLQRAITQIEARYALTCKAKSPGRTCLKISDYVPYCRETQEIVCVGEAGNPGVATIKTVHTSKNKRGLPQPRKLKQILLTVEGATPTAVVAEEGETCRTFGSEIEDELAAYYEENGSTCGPKPSELKWNCLNPTLDFLKIGCYAQAKQICGEGSERIKLKKIYRASFDKKAEGGDCAKVQNPSLFRIKIVR